MSLTAKERNRWTGKPTLVACDNSIRRAWHITASIYDQHLAAIKMECQFMLYVFHIAINVSAMSPLCTTAAEQQQNS